MKYIFIDDEPIFNMISKTKLQQMDVNADVLTFDSGMDALKYFAENVNLVSKEKLIIFLDINMPEMDGFDFLQEFNDKFDTSIQAIIFMLSSSIDSGDKEKAFQYPLVKNFHTKPFQLSYLNGIVN